MTILAFRKQIGPLVIGIDNYVWLLLPTKFDLILFMKQGSALSLKSPFRQTRRVDWWPHCRHCLFTVDVVLRSVWWHTFSLQLRCQLFELPHCGLAIHLLEITQN